MDEDLVFHVGDEEITSTYRHNEVNMEERHEHLFVNNGRQEQQQHENNASG